jgi:flagellar biogenesis protein FliO
MKTLSERLKILGAAFAAVLLLGIFLLRAQGGGRHAAFPKAALMIVVLSAAIAWWLRRRGARAVHHEAGCLTNVDSLNLQPGRTLYLIDLEGRRLLVSSSENGIRLVYELAATESGRSANDCGGGS